MAAGNRGARKGRPSTTCTARKQHSTTVVATMRSMFAIPQGGQGQGGRTGRGEGAMKGFEQRTMIWLILWGLSCTQVSDTLPIQGHEIVGGAEETQILQRYPTNRSTNKINKTNERTNERTNEPTYQSAGGRSGNQQNYRTSQPKSKSLGGCGSGCLRSSIVRFVCFYTRTAGSTHEHNKTSYPSECNEHGKRVGSRGEDARNDETNNNYVRRFTKCDLEVFTIRAWDLILPAGDAGSTNPLRISNQPAFHTGARTYSNAIGVVLLLQAALVCIVVHANFAPP